MPKVKKILPGAALIISFYFSVLFALGLIIGYFGTKHFHKKVVEKGKLKPIFFNFGKWEFHFHHWVMGVLVLFLIWTGGWLSFFPKFFLGGTLGIIFHDLYFDRKWYRVISRKQKIQGP